MSRLALARERERGLNSPATIGEEARVDGVGDLLESDVGSVLITRNDGFGLWQGLIIFSSITT